MIFSWYTPGLLEPSCIQLLIETVSFFISWSNSKYWSVRHIKSPESYHTFSKKFKAKLLVLIHPHDSLMWPKETCFHDSYSTRPYSRPEVTMLLGAKKHCGFLLHVSFLTVWRLLNLYKLGIVTSISNHIIKHNQVLAVIGSYSMAWSNVIMVIKT